jgi:hypothetical protein
VTDLERDASELVRDILDAACAALDVPELDGTVAASVDQAPFKARIVALAQKHGEICATLVSAVDLARAQQESGALSARTFGEQLMYRREPPRSTELL